MQPRLQDYLAGRTPAKTNAAHVVTAPYRRGQSQVLPIDIDDVRGLYVCTRSSMPAEYLAELVNDWRNVLRRELIEPGQGDYQEIETELSQIVNGARTTTVRFRQGHEIRKIEDLLKSVFPKEDELKLDVEDIRSLHEWAPRGAYDRPLPRGDVVRAWNRYKPPGFTNWKEYKGDAEDRFLFLDRILDLVQRGIIEDWTGIVPTYDQIASTLISPSEELRSYAAGHVVESVLHANIMSRERTWEKAKNKVAAVLRAGTSRTESGFWTGRIVTTNPAALIEEARNPTDQNIIRLVQMTYPYDPKERSLAEITMIVDTLRQRRSKQDINTFLTECMANRVRLDQATITPTRVRATRKLVDFIEESANRLERYNDRLAPGTILPPHDTYDLSSALSGINEMESNRRNVRELLKLMKNPSVSMTKIAPDLSLDEMLSVGRKIQRGRGGEEFADFIRGEGQYAFRAAVLHEALDLYDEQERYFKAVVRVLQPGLVDTVRGDDMAPVKRALADPSQLTRNFDRDYATVKKRTAEVRDPVTVLHELKTMRDGLPAGFDHEGRTIIYHRTHEVTVREVSGDPQISGQKSKYYSPKARQAAAKNAALDWLEQLSLKEISDRDRQRLIKTGLHVLGRDEWGRIEAALDQGQADKIITEIKEKLT